MKYAIIRDHLERYPKSLMCRAMSVSRSGLNKWLNRPESDRAQRKSLYEQKVMETFEEPRITDELNALGLPCSENFRVMPKSGV